MRKKEVNILFEIHSPSTIGYKLYGPGLVFTPLFLA
jgi:hypothetical protein